MTELPAEQRLAPALSGGACLCQLMRELATLRMGTGREIRVVVVREDAERDEIVLRRTTERGTAPTRDLIAVIDAHLLTATRHPAGTTDRLLAADRDLR